MMMSRWVTGADMDEGESSPPSQPSPVEWERVLIPPSPCRSGFPPARERRSEVVSQSVSGKPYLIRCFVASIRWQTLTPGVSPCIVLTRNCAMACPSLVRLTMFCCSLVGMHILAIRIERSGFRWLALRQVHHTSVLNLMFYYAYEGLACQEGNLVNLTVGLHCGLRNVRSVGRTAHRIGACTDRISLGVLRDFLSQLACLRRGR